MKHTWTDTRTTIESFEAVSEDGFTGLWARRKDQPLPDLVDTPVAAICAREILRLAQREADLVDRVKRLNCANSDITNRVQELDSLVAEQAERIVVLEEQKGAAEVALVARTVELTEKEHQLGLAKAATTTLEGHLQKVRDLQTETEGARLLALSEIRDLRALLGGSESKGRQYCLELAEKAEEIRRLKEDCCAQRDAILAALGHVETARGRLKRLDVVRVGGRVTPEDLEWFSARNRLDLAREALAGAAKRASGQGPASDDNFAAGSPPVDPLIEIRARLARLEIAKETAAFRADGLDERLAVLEERPTAVSKAEA